MPPIIPISQHFDQSTLGKLLDANAVVQRYRRLFALFDWSAIDPPHKRGPGNPGHPKSAYLKALLVRIGEHLSSTPRWRAYLLDHPLLVLELGFRPHLDFTEPYGFRVDKTVPSVRHPAQPGQSPAFRFVRPNRASAPRRDPRLGRGGGLRRQ